MNTHSLAMTLLLASFLTLLAGCQKTEYRLPDTISQQSLDLGTHKVETISMGSGEHTIVFENGLNTQMTIWAQPGIFEAVGSQAQVIGYNRGGYGLSEAGPEPRDMPRLISELDQVISSLSDNEKVILVGHSLGGAIARAYAVKYPEKIEALMLIEATHEDWLTLTQEDEVALVSEIYREDPNRIGPLGEARQFVEIFQYLKTLTNLPDRPTVAMASTKLENGITPGYVEGWLNINRTLGEGVSDFKLITTDQSGHQIHVEEPQLVIDAILDLIY